MDDELAANFMAVTGADENIARQLLDMANGDLPQAVLLYYETDEEEDEAMAKRLQEEMYAETATTSDGIRAPIARTTEVLVEPSYGGIGGGVGDGFGGGADAIYEQLRRRQQRQPAPANPFSQARLADLFRPPYDLMERCSWEEARAMGKAEKRWILANLQDMSDFLCQALNRDIWKDRAIRELVRENFVFLQFSREDPEAQSYVQYYLPGGQDENPDNYPHVAIVDPRTGEQVKVWSERPFPSAASFHAQLAEFLDRYSLDSTRKNPVQTGKARQPARDVERMTEEEMLEMALQNSLETSGSGSAGGGGGGVGVGSGTESRPSLQDPDELTKGETETEETEETEEVSESSAAFARIASDRPHEEPANGPSTTRIQFRHPTGRVIRRFAADDRVLRIYEWLKAEPLEGKDGLEFELKVVPQGHDLLEDLDKTIEEAGLKQATVMIEFIE
ncbi:ubx domain containing protein [Grosmannia clavigera kw1407]|uniref:Ubx domain containing protein n=1 Tax=Grosmannia clavigera (strain kw1407 / UAMH 11150) TaxID=655863 RepID=F0XQR2_GROCL|nr:ubx domain containing protein [Grosmannia clavigera kw1407]EFW99857.1 ubx domain containing protein [Grosmannia clavigera kw1407]